MIASFKNSFKITLQVLGLSVVSFILLGISIAIFGESGEVLLIPNPLTSGFIHSGFNHIGYNLLLVFIFTLPAMNAKYDIKKLFWITFIISCAYLPISLLGITTHAIGISGTCYFLITRAFFGNKIHIILKSVLLAFLGFTLLGEYISMTGDTPDDTAHGVHFIGVILGLISLYVDPKIIPSKIRKVIL